jgi:hypothetical protein
MYVKNVNNLNDVDLLDKLQDSYKLFLIADVLTSNHLLIISLKNRKIQFTLIKFPQYILIVQ